MRMLFNLSRKSMMGTSENKQLLQSIFDGLATGDGRTFNESLADDFCWHMIGDNAWSGSYRGKKEVREKLLDPLFEQFATRYTNKAVRFIAEGDFVVVECRGDVMAKTGKRYNNTYCWVCRVEDGKLKELMEYMDTALVERALGKPFAEASAG